ncbi:MAG TPA: aminoacetone oxidase family FAD-binding enzyme, partial [Clostridiales bacterium]|nr:aminoacetone oxidase family FAD-binding enzyme [Clostridiales bacterium]
MKYDVIIIGAGASGLMAAIAAGRNGSSVLVIEHKDKAGKKILATGNGKCNYTNLLQEDQCYRSDDSLFPQKVLKLFNTDKTIEFFKELGIYPKERNGYLYPNSEQSTSVVQVLLMECRRLGVTFNYNEKIIRFTKPNFTLITDHGTYYGKKLILATGGCASSKHGSDGSGYDYAKFFGHSIIKPLPALVQLKSSDKFRKTISGVRIVGNIKAFGNDKAIAEEIGEVVFTDYGISGIPIMQISRFVAKALDKKNNVKLKIDFLSDKTKNEVLDILKYRITYGKGKSVEEMMVGLFNNKLSYVMILKTNIDPAMICDKLEHKDLEKLVDNIKQFTMAIID